MNLTFLRQSLELALPKLENLRIERVLMNGLYFWQFEDLRDLKAGISKIQTLGIFQPLIETIINSSYFALEDEKLILNESDGGVLNNQLKKIIDVLSFTTIAFQKIISETSETTLLIKIAEPADLDSLSRNIDKFQKILSGVVIHPAINGSIIFEGVEPGSTWIKINVKNILSVALVGSLFWSSAVIYKKYQENKLMREVIESKQLENKQKEKLLEAQEIIIDFMVEAEAYQLFNTYYKGESVDHEQIERLKHSIKLLSEEISKGAEINPSLTAPEQVSNLFPNIKQLPLLESTIKKIGEK